jgi:hypothetical protein
MLTLPAESAGEMAVIEVVLLTVYEEALVPPNVAAVTVLNPVPVIATEVPPAMGPLFGETPVTVTATTGVTYVNWSADTVALVPTGVTTFISTAPAETAGDVADTAPSPSAVNEAAVEPKYTWVAPVKFVP